MNQNSKFQIKALGSFDIGNWSLFGIWDLEFGILNAMRFAACGE
jgi:hypothetical protein